MRLARRYLSYSNLLYLLAIPFTLAFTAKAMQIHDVFGTAAYDLGIADQSIWLMSRFEPVFNTIRGIHAHGDHFRPIEAIFAPLYWIYPSVLWLFFLQVLSVTTGALVLYRLGNSIVADQRFLSFAFSVSFFLNPVVHNTLLWQYHDFVFTTALAMVLVHAYLRDRLGTFVVTLFLLLLCREDVGIITAAFGMLALLQKKWKYGVITVLCSVLWVAVVFLWVMPYLNGEGYFRHDAGSLSRTWAHFLDWRYYVERIFLAPDSRQYVLFIFFPLLFVPLLGIEYLIPAVPSILVNTLIGGYNTQIGYHYSAMTVPFVYTAGVVGAGRMLRMAQPAAARNWMGPALGTLLILVGSYSFVQYSALAPERAAESYRAWMSKGKLRQDVRRLLGQMGPHAGVAASDFLVPHLSQRRKIYLFPNPWQVHYWGIRGENPHHPNEVDYIVVAPGQYNRHHALLLYLEKSGLFRRKEASRDMIVLERARPEDPDRAQALARVTDFYRTFSAIRFKDIRISPMFRGNRQDFGRLHLDPAVCSPDRDWKHLGARTERLLDVDFNDELAGGGVGTAYVCADIELDRERTLELLLGSDDGLTVWVNGRKALEHLVDRTATLGDDRMRVTLGKGTNRIVFRVNNAGGAWRLLAFAVPVDEP